MSSTVSDFFNVRFLDGNLFFKKAQRILNEENFTFFNKINDIIVSNLKPTFKFFSYYDDTIFYMWVPDKYIKSLEVLKLMPNDIIVELESPDINILEISPNCTGNGNSFLVIKNYNIPLIKYLPISKKFEYPTRSRNSKFIRLDIYNLYNIYFYGNGKTFPLTLKALDYFKKDEFRNIQEIITMLFELGLNSDLIWKDLVSNPSDWKEKCYPPVKFKELENTHNKKELFEKKFKKALPNSINKDSFSVGFYKIKAAQLFDEKEKQKIYNINVPENFFKFFYTEEERANKIIHIYYESIFGDISKFDGFYVDDYIHMSRVLKNPISLKFKSINGLMRVHQKLSEQIKLNDMPEIKIPKRYSFKKLKLPEKYELITTKERLYAETTMNCNCVWSYADKINDGDCAIYSVVENGNRYTIEICMDYDNNFYIEQMFGYKNSFCPQEYIDELLGHLEAHNEKNIRIK